MGLRTAPTGPRKRDRSVKTPFGNILYRDGCCYDAIKWVRGLEREGLTDPNEIWKACGRGDWMTYVLCIAVDTPAMNWGGDVRSFFGSLLPLLIDRWNNEVDVRGERARANKIRQYFPDWPL